MEMARVRQADYAVMWSTWDENRAVDPYLLGFHSRANR